MTNKIQQLVEKYMVSEANDTLQKALKKFGNDPLYKKVLTAKSKKEQEAAIDTLKRIRGNSSYKQLIDYIQKISYKDFLKDKDMSKSASKKRLKDMGMSEAKSMSSRMVKDYEKRAKAERRAGGKIEINYRLSYVAVTMSDGSEYFFQGQEASELLDDVPDNINEEDFILAIAQGW